MVSRLSKRRSGMVTVEVIVAMAIVTVGIWPLLVAFSAEEAYLKQCHERAVINELLEGEMEALLAGEWREYEVGEHVYAVPESFQALLPDAGPEACTLIVSTNRIRLEWQGGSGVHRTWRLYREAPRP